MKVLSLDTSTTTTGYAVYTDGNLSHYSSIDKADIKDTAARLSEMVAGVFRLIETEKPDAVAIEETVVPRNPQTQRMLTMILGAVYGKCLQDGIHYSSLRPTQWRAAVRGKDEKLPRHRDELKAWSISKVKELYGVTGVDDNIADAILIGKAFINFFVRKQAEPE